MWKRLLILSLPGLLLGADETLPKDARNALRRGVAFFRERVAVHGTYLWQYSADLSLREGEERATATQGWVQPPGTPSVGLAFLSAWEANGDRYYLEAARETAQGLLRGQLQSGGWEEGVLKAWPGSQKILRTSTFIANVVTLAAYLKQEKAGK